MTSVRANGLFEATRKGNRPCIDNANVCCVKPSSILLGSFREKCHNRVNAKKKEAKELFFFLQGTDTSSFQEAQVPMSLMSKREPRK